MTDESEFCVLAAMRRGWLTMMAVLFAQGTQAAELLSRIHVDHAFRFNGGSWDIVLHGNDGDPDLDPEEYLMAVFDQPYPSEGGRIARPGGAQWDFVGVDAGQDVWVIPQSYTPLIWPGFRTEGNFAEYYNGDPRLGFTSRFVKVSVMDVSYAGSGDGHFSIWNTLSGGVTKVWASTADGIATDDAYYFSSGHAHTNFGFSDPGVYHVDYQASAFLGNDGGDPLVGTNPVVSHVQGFYYAVGTYAKWKASYYEPVDLVDQDLNDSLPEVTHDASDTDKDGIVLLLEYAFNLSPVEADYQQLTPGSGTAGMPVGSLDESGLEPMLALEYVRRRAEGSPRLTYRPQFSTSLNGDWIDVDEADKIVTTIDETWERVRVVDPAGSVGASARFGRVLVELE